MVEGEVSDESTPTEGTGTRILLTERRCQIPLALVAMSIAFLARPYSNETSWRGVKYDPKAEKKTCETKSVVETYRGIQHTEQVRVCK